MSQPRPRVRSACEACHKRKQRCIIPDAGGACQACQQHSRQCYFFPRFRPGRPQRKQADSAAYASASTNGASSSPTPISPPTGLDLRLGQAADQLEMVPTEPEVLSQNSSNAEPQSMDLDVFQESLGRMWETVFVFINT